MNDVLLLELTPEDRELLLQGLRFVRRSVMLETREPSVKNDAQREDQLDEIQVLSQRLEAIDPLPAASV